MEMLLRAGDASGSPPLAGGEAPPQPLLPDQTSLVAVARRVFEADRSDAPEILKELVKQAGSAQSAATAILDTCKDASVELQGLGAHEIRGLAYIVQHRESSATDVALYFANAGNMQAVFREDMQAFGDFLSKFPDAVAAMPSWSVQATQQHSALLAACAAALGEPGKPLSVGYLNEALGQPSCDQDVVKSLANAARGPLIPGLQREQISILAAALVHAEDPVAVAGAVAEHSFNLLQALPSSQIGPALSTGLVPWPVVQLWTTPSPAAPKDGTLQVPQRASVVPAVTRPMPQLPKGIPARQREGHQRSNTDILESDYADLRQLGVPDPNEMEGKYVLRCREPCSGPEVKLCRFQASNMVDPRIRRWEFWVACTEMQVFPRPIYAFTDWANTVTPCGTRVPNSTISGNPGQEVVRTPWGTLTWIPNDRSIAVSSDSPELERRVRCVFAPWDPDTDMPKSYHGNKLPLRIQSVLGSRQSPGAPQPTPFR